MTHEDDDVVFEGKAASGFLIPRKRTPEAQQKECDYACGFQEPYGFVPEADCPVHDAPKSKVE